ncbi:MAG: TRAP transporter small permease [Peptococcaceae bacterium]|nr:TRAP transporter small permease [Peptococcaceae bacterium]
MKRDPEPCEKVGSLAKTAEKAAFVFFLTAGVLLFFMTFLVTVSSLTRYGFNSPIAASIDITGFILYFVTFLSAPWILKQDRHVSVDILKEYLPLKKQRFLAVVNNLIMVLASTVIFGYGAYLTHDQFSRAEKLFGTLEIPKCILTAVIPLSGLLLVAISLIRLVQSVCSLRTVPTPVRKEE